jgi:hypothetical protein
MVRPQELWGRRTLGVGVILVVLAVVGGVILLITGGGGGGSSSSRNPSLADVQDKLLQTTVVVPPKGISVRRPASWTDVKRNGNIRIRSQDGCLVMTLSAPTDAGSSRALMQQSVRYLRQNYKGVSVRSVGNSQLGGIPTAQNAVSLRDPKGRPVSILLAIGTGKKYAYLTNVTARPTCVTDLTVGQIVLSSLQYTK